jgi:ATP-dependent Clp protease protease subunit
MPIARTLNKSPTRFWAYDEAAEGQPAVLRLEGPIATETWWGDEVTPEAFRADLEAHPGDIEVYINSPGGDVIAGSMIYTMLKEHKGAVTVKVAGIAASAASVVAMAGDTVLMAPTAYMMIHNAMSIAFGNKHDMRHEGDVLDEVDKGIRAAYRMRTGMSDAKLARLMDEETWMSAATAMALGFADGIIGAEPDEADPEEDPDEEEPDEAEPERRRDDALDALGYALADPLGRMRGLPAVAYSPIRQQRALAYAVKAQAAIDSVSARRSNRRKQAQTSLQSQMAAMAIADELTAYAWPAPPEADPTDLLRRKLRLISQ